MIIFNVELWVDNAEVLKRANESMISPLILDYDLCMATKHWISQIKYKLTWSKVDAHIDNKLRTDSTRVLQGNCLAWRLNTAVDQLAGDKCAEEIGNETESFFPPSKVMVLIADSMVYGSIYDRLTFVTHAKPMEEYLCKKFNWTKLQFDCIDWEAMGSFIKSVTPTKETNICKLVLNWQNDNHQRQLFNKKEDGVCPLCNVAHESHMHFLHCPDVPLRRANRKACNKVITII